MILAKEKGVAVETQLGDEDSKGLYRKKNKSMGCLFNESEKNILKAKLNTGFSKK